MKAVELHGKEARLRFDPETSTITIYAPLGKVMTCGGQRAFLLAGYVLGVMDKATGIGPGDALEVLDAFCQGVAFGLPTPEAEECWQVEAPAAPSSSEQS